MVVRVSPIKLLAMLIATIALGYHCQLLADGELRISGTAASEAFAGKMRFLSWIGYGCAVCAAYQLVFGNRERAEISPQGLWAPGISQGLIPWSDIQSISIQTISALWIFRIDSADVVLVTGSRSDLACLQSKASRCINLSMTGVSGVEFMAAVQQARSGAERQTWQRSVEGAGRRLTPSRQGFGRRV